MTQMFKFANSFNQAIGGWSTGSVTDMSEMFSSSAFNSIIENWNTNSVTNMSWMFSSNTVYNQPFTNWDTSSVYNMAPMFYGATSFDQSIAMFNISSLTNAENILIGSSFSGGNYDLLLVAWAAQPTIQSNVTFDVSTTYFSCAGWDTGPGRFILTDTFAWSITDGGNSYTGGAACPSR